MAVSLTVDTNCIHARGQLGAMNTLERWSGEGKVRRIGSIIQHFRPRERRKRL